MSKRRKLKKFCSLKKIKWQFIFLQNLPNCTFTFILLKEKFAECDLLIVGLRTHILTV